ncbi:MAG: 1-(5-phosphoribosyl)-5-[(5-phosphoribosylamino)methylideneamino]imidazole-4-carboxamide isomerase [Leptospira sp.]|nr:1-(5-phosphoribosyl)-5-[(5-phosphoribosylamino)methylideneamino]imidazole-4-carboxamide isomerase [Leptospira sp.]
MKIIPAIDLLDNEAVRLTKGDYSLKTVYSKNPEEMVKIFEESGAEIIHVVDLNAARTGMSTNQKSIENIKSKTKVKMELGGGIRSLDQMKFYSDLGVERLILGTAAVENPKLVEEGLKIYGVSRIVVGIDSKDGFVRTKGWETNSGIPYMKFLKDMYNLGVRHIIFTDINKDGMMMGPNLNLYLEILDTFSDIFIVASGGVSAKEDLLELFTASQGRIFGAITGKAIYEGKLNLKECISLINEKRISLK